MCPSLLVATFSASRHFSSLHVQRCTSSKTPKPCPRKALPRCCVSQKGHSFSGCYSQGNWKNRPVIMLLTVLFASSSKIIISSALLFFSLTEHTPAFAEMPLASLLPAVLGLLAVSEVGQPVGLSWGPRLTQGIRRTNGEQPKCLELSGDLVEKRCGSSGSQEWSYRFRTLSLLPQIREDVLGRIGEWQGKGKTDVTVSPKGCRVGFKCISATLSVCLLFCLFGFFCFPFFHYLGGGSPGGKS